MVKPEHKGFPASYPYGYSKPIESIEPIEASEVTSEPEYEDPLADILKAMARGRAEPVMNSNERVQELLRYSIDDNTVQLIIREYNEDAPGLKFATLELYRLLDVSTGFSLKEDRDKDLTVIEAARKAKLGIRSVRPAYGIVGYVYVDRKRMARVRRNFKPILIRR